MTTERVVARSQSRKSATGTLPAIETWWIRASASVRSGRPRSGSGFRSAPFHPSPGGGSTTFTVSGRIFCRPSSRSFR